MGEKLSVELTGRQRQAEPRKAGVEAVGMRAAGSVSWAVLPTRAHFSSPRSQDGGTKSKEHGFP